MKFNKWPLAFIFETNRFIGKNFDGRTFGPFVFVRPGTSKHLLVHELVHVKQFWRYLGFNGILYLVSKKWRLKFELEAYRAQHRSGTNAHNAARALATLYNLDISESEAYAMIKDS